ncbi:hypothetical protein GH810_07325 [Acetobacterium paludosum]|uniref:DUF1097 domain-containing protein n=1 Tax=Acetobacterium paludosum TaxID=52693 RepID=A0A923HVU2_9FIRM|nr:hypothetical protein [Acetobacterium paludosum]MBC3888117.1 hypothetical protein [Acetobacterium paludosum]
MNELPLGKKIITSFIITLISILVFIGIGMGFAKIGIPIWPFVLFLLYFSTIDAFDKSKLWQTAIGGLIGITVAMSQGIVTELTLNPGAGVAVFAILAIAVVTMFIMGNVPYVNIFTMILVALMTAITFTPGNLAGFPGVEMNYIEAYIRVLSSYALGVVLFVIITNIMAKKAMNAQPTVEKIAE